MRINAINPGYSVNTASNLKSTKVNKVSDPIVANKTNFALISFKGNPAKHPDQIAAYATESNYLGGIYKAGGLGDVAEALPEAIANHGEAVTGKPVDVRTFFPYYSFDDNEGRMYVAKKGTEEKLANKTPLVRSEDFKLVDQNYNLEPGE